MDSHFLFCAVLFSWIQNTSGIEIEGRGPPGRNKNDLRIWSLSKSVTLHQGCFHLGVNTFCRK